MDYINGVFNIILRKLFIPTDIAPRLAQYQYYQKQKRLTFPEKKVKSKPKIQQPNNPKNNPKNNNEWHMYCPEHCLRVFVVYRESLLSIVEHYRNQKYEALLRGNIDERMNENRMHSYVCALYNYTHIGDYARFNVEYQSDLYLSVRDKTLQDLGVDLDQIGNTLLIALAVTANLNEHATNTNDDYVDNDVDEDDDDYAIDDTPTTTTSIIHSVNIYLRNSTLNASDRDFNKSCILTTTIKNVEFNIHQLTSLVPMNS